MKFDAIGKDTPDIELDCTGVLVFTSTDCTAHMAEIHWVVHNFGIKGDHFGV